VFPYGGLGEYSNIRGKKEGRVGKERERRGKGQDRRGRMS